MTELLPVNCTIHVPTGNVWYPSDTRGAGVGTPGCCVQVHPHAGQCR